jgi:hypothetical protein
LNGFKNSVIIGGFAGMGIVTRLIVVESPLFAVAPVGKWNDHGARERVLALTRHSSMSARRSREITQAERLKEDG